MTDNKEPPGSARTGKPSAEGSLRRPLSSERKGDAARGPDGPVRKPPWRISQALDSPSNIPVMCRRKGIVTFSELRSVGFTRVLSRNLKSSSSSVQNHLSPPPSIYYSQYLQFSSNDLSLKLTRQEARGANCAAVYAPGNGRLLLHRPRLPDNDHIQCASRGKISEVRASLKMQKRAVRNLENPRFPRQSRNATANTLPDPGETEKWRLGRAE